MKLLLALASLCACSSASAPDLVLRLGTLRFPPSRAASLAAAAAYRAVAYAVAFDAAATASARASIAAALAPCGGAVASLLPPNLAFQVVAREEGTDAADLACLLAVHAAPGVLAVTPIPAELRMEAALLSSDGANNGERAPLRSVSLMLARHADGASAHAVRALRRDLAPHLAALCGDGHCDVVHVSDFEALLTAFAGACENGGRDGAIHHDSPAELGCVLPVELARRAAAHPEVVYASRVEQVYAANAFGRATTETTDVVSWPGVVQEFGACTGAECDLSGYIPFSSIAPMYGQQLRASVGASGPAASEFAVSDPRAASRAAPRARAAVAARSSPLPPPPSARRLGVTYPDHPEKILASVPFPPSLGFDAAFEAQNTCSAACSGGACDFGFARCAGLVTPIAAEGLTGRGQIVHVADTGIDPFLPFFMDPAEGVNGPPIVQNLVGPCVAPYNVTTCAQSYPPLTAARKTVGIWAYADGVDASTGTGHGTHVVGSVTGNAGGLGDALDPVDASVLRAFKGSAAEARLLFADIACNTPTGCVAGRTLPIVPPRAGGCGNNALCLPSDYWNLFGPAYRSGARVSSNSWGGGTISMYTEASAKIDNMIYSFASDLLIVWSAANAGTGGFYTISAQAVSKNSLTVGATYDGLYAHLGKARGVGNNLDEAGNPSPLAPLYGFMDGRACGAIVLNAAAQNASSLVATGGACPASPSNVQCYRMAVDGQQNVDPPPGGFVASSQYGGVQQIELPMCCGCSPRQVVDGCLAPGSAPDGVSPACAPGNNVLNLLLQGLVDVYNSRWPTDFSSLGPAEDGRIKPDVTMPGFDIISARSSQWVAPGQPVFNYVNGAQPPPSQVRNRPYNVWTCPPTAAALQWSWTPSNVTYVSAAFTVPVSELIATIVIAPLIEPIRVDQIVIPVSNVAPPPAGCPAVGGCWIEALIFATTEQGSQMYPVRAQQLAMGVAAPQNVTLTIPAGNFPAGFTGPRTGWHMGANWAGSIQIYGTPGMSFTLQQNAPGVSPATTAPCFTTSISNPLLFYLTLARGSGRAYATPSFGTSMSAPLMAGTAVLVGQYYSEGWLGAGAPTPGAGFRPSAALVKATLINSATAAIEEANDRLFNLPSRPRWQLDAQAGFGVPSLPRGLSFATLGPLTRAAGQLPTLLVPGLIVVPPVNGAVQRAIEPAIATGEDHVYCVDTFVTPSAFPPSNNGSGIPLSITLVWTDPPVAPTAAQQLVNNLDLLVFPPIGPRATGNSGNSSAPNQLPDTINNVEKITFAAPVSTLGANGERAFNAYEVVVRATSVPQGPQAYALVVTGPGLTATTTLGQRGCPSPPSPAPTPGPGGGGANAGTGTADGTVPAATFNTTVAALSAAVAVLGAGLGVIYFRGGRGGGAPPTFSSAAGYAHTSASAGGLPPTIKVTGGAVPWGERRSGAAAAPAPAAPAAAAGGGA